MIWKIWRICMGGRVERVSGLKSFGFEEFQSFKSQIPDMNFVFDKQS